MNKAKKPESPSVPSKVKKPEPRPFSLRAVYLREGKQWMSDDFDPMLPGQPLSGQFMVSGPKFELQEAVENIPEAKTIRSFRVASGFAFRYLNIQMDTQLKEGEEEKHLVVEISARITVDYLIEVPETPPQEKLEQWASNNALLHCWPYWREFCHSTLLRMNLPITMIPMMEVNQTKNN